MRFGRYTVDTRSRRFEVDGQAVELGSRAFDLLVALIESRGTIVSKEEIIRRVWPDVVVDEANLRVQLAKVRKALDDDRHLIRTVPSRGYLFAGDVPVAIDPMPDGAAIGPAPPVTSAEIVPEPLGNLPKPMHSLIGRSIQLMDLRHSIGQHRLVTLVGPGGIGKTRLAIAAGRAMAPSFPDGVWLIDLAPLADPQAVTSVAATVLGIRLSQMETAVSAIASAIGTRRMLLIFDNCEHLIGAAAELIRQSLARAPGLSVVATSQERLDIQGEQVCRLGPLDVPSDARGDVLGFGAVALFVERACAADRSFVLDQVSRERVVEICRRLDGIPLALEMAAARVPLLGLGGLLKGLDERLRMLKGSKHGIRDRHRTLLDMVEWSYGLLDRADQEVFRRLAIFAGLFSLEAAAAVAGSDRSDRWDMADSLGRLLDKSLIAIEPGEPPHYRLLETLRLYAAERLAESGEREACAERHARYFAERSGQVHDAWPTTPEPAWLAMAQLDLDNIRVALDWALADPSRAPTAIALAGAAGRHWSRLGLIAEGKRYTDRALPLISPETPPVMAARLLQHAGGLRVIVAEGPAALTFLKQAEALYRQIDDRIGLASVLAIIGAILSIRSEFAEARTLLNEAKDLLADQQSTKQLFSIENALGIVASTMDEPAEARTSYVRALQLAREMGNAAGEGEILNNLADLEFGCGNIERAIDWAQKAVSQFRSCELFPRLGLALYNLATYLIAKDELSTARPHAEEALSLAGDAGGLTLLACLQQWALIGALEGRHDEAARLLGFVELTYASTGEVREKPEQQIYDRLSALLATALSPASLQNRAAEGASWSEAQALRFTIDRLVPYQFADGSVSSEV
ncbi:hypothetical protein GCM10011611_65290 [Aliidongia dinghuensis]|uniref:OmpR/PhoB-type domain-containing protein n=2 Tax=Aliidongia dinghuensis TaxID=1867774 RepID=A0A8J2Z1K7_9PROT|nr:hypothetical protein GCM10011611_65290 [Aliidongia dinghuensis]